MNVKCQVFTPPDYVVALLNSADYKKDLMGKTILENSCGDGNILLEVVRRYIADCRRKGYSRDVIKKGLENDIIGIEIDEIQYKKCINNLNHLLDKENIPIVSWKIYNNDFLRIEDAHKYDYIIGNPPYITYSEIKIEDREYLRRKYISCKKGKFDYCYAFIEKSLSMLCDNGKMAYLIPSSIFKTVSGGSLRTMLCPFVSSIFDYTQEKLFDSALVKSAIIVLTKDNQGKTFSYKDNTQKRMVKVKKAELGGKWVFNAIESGQRRFGDYFKVANAVATLLNEAYILKEYKQDTNGNYLCGKYTIERSIVRDAASPKSLKKDVLEKIIFPYAYAENELVRYDNETIKKQFPGAYKYLLNYRTKLSSRDCEKNVSWYEYGRSQALASLNREKCLISRVVSSEVVIYKLNKECIPYAGMFIIPKENNNEYDLDSAIQILKSPQFMKYVEAIGTHINGNSLRITSKDIEDFMF